MCAIEVAASALENLSRGTTIANSVNINPEIRNLRFRSQQVTRKVSFFCNKYSINSDTLTFLIYTSDGFQQRIFNLFLRQLRDAG